VTSGWWVGFSKAKAMNNELSARLTIRASRSLQAGRLRSIGRLPSSLFAALDIYVPVSHCEDQHDTAGAGSTF
jgi:hypothetical protein